MFEKVGVNVSHVWGVLASRRAARSPARRQSDGRFVACGISLVAHMCNPYVPAVHMNLRYLCTSRAWFGGGVGPDAHVPVRGGHRGVPRGAARRVRWLSRRTRTREFKAWCDRYFYLPHRQEPRGVGGIFFDDLAERRSRTRTSRFVRAVGEAFLQRLSARSSRAARTRPSMQTRASKLLYKRGRYVEFNLVYDRGTRFGFSTDADPEAYLMSLPPLVKW